MLLLKLFKNSTLTNAVRAYNNRLIIISITKRDQLNLISLNDSRGSECIGPKIHVTLAYLLICFLLFFA